MNNINTVFGEGVTVEEKIAHFRKNRKELKQITQEEFDERYYFDEDKVNVRTGLNYFPSVTYIKGRTLPKEDRLIEWIAGKGYDESKRFMNYKAELGSYVHDTIERAMKDGYVVTPEEIDTHFMKDPKGAAFVKNCLKSCMAFIAKHQPRIIECEANFCADDYAGTIDIVCSFPNSDNPDEVFVLDWKTSSGIYEDHEIQAEAYMRAKGADSWIIVQLGNSKTKQGYSVKCRKPERGAWLYKKWNILKDLYYHGQEPSSIKPRVVEYPEKFEFPLSEINEKSELALAQKIQQG